MNRLQCDGRPSEVASKVVGKELNIKPLCGNLADPVSKKSVDSKPKLVNKTPNGIPSISSLNPKRSTAQKPKAQLSRGNIASKAPSFRNVTTHGRKLPKQGPPDMTDCQVKFEGLHKPPILNPLVASTTEEQTRSDDEEDDSRNVEKHVPLELLAEFLQAVMTKNFQLARKLCQMILIYEPQNTEAKSFLPLIEVLLEADKESDEDSDGSEDDDDSDDDDDDDDDDVSSDSCDSDDESSENSDTLTSSSQ